MRNLGNCVQRLWIPSGDAIYLISFHTVLGNNSAENEIYEIEEDDSFFLDTVREEYLDCFQAGTAGC